ncbi:MAG: hypothetical protein AAFR37_24925 [Cyanobacteria bacterium J06628_3]
MSVLETNQFDIHEQAQHKSRRQRKRHRGSGRRYFYKTNKAIAFLNHL